MVTLENLRKRANFIKIQSMSGKDCKYFKRNFIHLCHKYVDENYIFWDYFTLTNLNSNLMNKYYDTIFVYDENKIIDCIVLI